MVASFHNVSSLDPILYVAPNRARSCFTTTNNLGIMLRAAWKQNEHFIAGDLVTEILYVVVCPVKTIHSC